MASSSANSDGGSDFSSPQFAGLHTNAPPASIQQSISARLNSRNFQLWKAQMTPLLLAYDLMGIVDGSRPSPARFVANSAGTPIPNPEFATWFRLDQLVLSWMISTVSDEIGAQILKLTTSNAVWKFLQSFFATHSRAKVYQLKSELHSLRKGDLSVSDYIYKAKAIATGLAATEKSLDDEDLVLAILNGLGPDFDAIVALVTSRPGSISYDELVGLLLQHEQRISHRQSPIDVSVNVAVKDTGRGHRGKTRGRGRGRNTYQELDPSGPGGRSSSKPSVAGVQCQICGKLNHSAVTCYYRYNHVAEHPQANLHSTGRSPHNGVGILPSPGATAYNSIPVNAGASNNSINTQLWFPDSGATHHLTNSLANLDISQPYYGPEEVKVGNGAARTSNATGASQGCTKGSFLSLRHPKSGNPTSYFFQGCSLHELNWYKQSFGSWFLGNHVSEDGSMYFATPVDPVFILLPLFEAARMKSEKDRGMFRELNEIFYVDGFPAYQHLLPIAEASIRPLCEMKEIGTSRFFRLDDSKVLSWLCIKVSSLKIALSKLDNNYAAREEKETLLDAVSLLGEYLKDDPWMKLLCGHFQLDLQDARRNPPLDTFSYGVDSPQPPSQPQAKRSNGKSTASTGKQSKKLKTQVDSKNIKDMFRRATRSGGS